MENKIRHASFESKQTSKLPAGAEVVKKSISVQVEEIENGFVIRKSYDIEYTMQMEEGTKYFYVTKKWFSKKNPLTIDMKGEKPLEDKL